MALPMAGGLRSPHQRPLFRREAVEIEHHDIFLAVCGLYVGEEAEGAGALLLEVREPLGFLGEGHGGFNVWHTFEVCHTFCKFGEEGGEVERFPVLERTGEDGQAELGLHEREEAPLVLVQLAVEGEHFVGGGSQI